MNLSRAEGVHDLLGDLVAPLIGKARGDGTVLVVHGSPGHEYGGHHQHGSQYGGGALQGRRALPEGFFHRGEGHKGVDRHTAQHEENQTEGGEAEGYLFIERDPFHRNSCVLGGGDRKAQLADVS